MHIADYVKMTYFLASTLCYMKLFRLIIKGINCLYQRTYLESPVWEYKYEGEATVHARFRNSYRRKIWGI